MKCSVNSSRTCIRTPSLTNFSGRAITPSAEERNASRWSKVSVVLVRLSAKCSKMRNLSQKGRKLATTWKKKISQGGTRPTNQPTLNDHTILTIPFAAQGSSRPHTDTHRHKIEIAFNSSQRSGFIRSKNPGVFTWLLSRGLRRFRFYFISPCCEPNSFFYCYYYKVSVFLLSFLSHRPTCSWPIAFSTYILIYSTLYARVVVPVGILASRCYSPPLLLFSPFPGWDQRRYSALGRGCFRTCALLLCPRSTIHVLLAPPSCNLLFFFFCFLILALWFLLLSYCLLAWFCFTVDMKKTNMRERERGYIYLPILELVVLVWVRCDVIEQYLRSFPSG